MAEELPDDPTLIMEVLFDIRKDTRYIIDLLEEDDGEEEAEDARGAGSVAGARRRARPPAPGGDHEAEGAGGRTSTYCRGERLAPELQLVPGRRRRELQQRALAARLEVGELGGVVVPRHVQAPVLDTVVEPRAAEHELAEPVDERLAVHEREPLPVAHEVAPELAPRVLDHAVRGQLDEVLRLLVVQLVVVHEPEPKSGRADPLGEVGRVAAEAEAEELDDDVVTGRRITTAPGGLGATPLSRRNALPAPMLRPQSHATRSSITDAPCVLASDDHHAPATSGVTPIPPRLNRVSSKAVLASGLVTAALVLLVVLVFEVSLERAAVLAPVIVVAFGAAAAVVVLWAKVGWEALQRRRRPWLVAGIAAAIVALIAALSLLGLELPRE